MILVIPLMTGEGLHLLEKGEDRSRFALDLDDTKNIFEISEGSTLHHTDSIFI